MSEAAALPRREPGRHWPPGNHALDDAVEQIFAGVPVSAAPTAPPYVLACPPDRHADVRDFVTAVGLGHLVEVRPTDIVEGDDAMLFRRRSGHD